MNLIFDIGMNVSSYYYRELMNKLHTLKHRQTMELFTMRVGTKKEPTKTINRFFISFDLD